MSEHRGYSTVLVARAGKLDPISISSRLAKACFNNNVSVVELTAILKVSRAAIYGWFRGDSYPRRKLHPEIEALITHLQTR